jgi:hypothetical protein
MLTTAPVLLSTVRAEQEIDAVVLRRDRGASPLNGKS